ncbi:MAG: hypothetical protein JSV24_05990 [Bacteroidales bacterium]|nr:MAG: hypothetical protein JSV24_05990 [Bacteroidales bacterium]
MNKIKKIRNFIVVSLLMAYMIVVLGLTSDNSEDRICNAIHIHILDSLENRLMTEEDILGIIEKGEGQILGYPVGEINIRTMENNLKSYPYIKKAEVFICVDGSLRVDIEQRRPVMRVINRYQESYYLASDGTIMPLSRTFTPRVLVANGNVGRWDGFMNVLKNEVAGDNEMILSLYRIARFVDQDDFWKAQIEQIYVDSSGELELIPRVGAHIIEFGKPVDFDRKFRNLMAFYEQGLEITGWNRYERISLKYEGQVVCTLR